MSNIGRLLNARVWVWIMAIRAGDTGEIMG
jgi:hypothetical protein